jgi:hypothetical protein
VVMLPVALSAIAPPLPLSETVDVVPALVSIFPARLVREISPLSPIPLLGALVNILTVVMSF